MEKHYKISLSCGLIPFITLISTIFLLLTYQHSLLKAIITPLLGINIVLVLVGLFSLNKFYTLARKRQSQRNINRSLLPFFLLVVNFPLLIITYYTDYYVQNTHTVIINNQSEETIKKMFFSNGDDKYFVKPIEPGETYVKALLFKVDGKVTYSLSLKNKTLTGTLIDNIKAGDGFTAQLNVTRTKKVIVGETTQ